MNTNRNGYKVLVALAVLVIVSLACGGGGGDNDQVVITPTAIDVGDDTANELVEGAIETIEKTNRVMVLIGKLNCKLGFESCGEKVKDLEDVFSPE